jgi:hypothetical protein
MPAATFSMIEKKKKYWEDMHKIANELFTDISNKYSKDHLTIFNLMFSLYENKTKRLTKENWKTSL